MPSRPVLGIVAGAPTPYRVHLHQRLASELDVELYCVYMGRGRRFSEVAHPPSTHPHFASDAGRKGWLWGWRTGRDIIRHLRSASVDAVIVNGYADLARIRVIESLSRRLPVFVRGDSNVRGDRAAGIRGMAKRLLLGRLLRRASGALVMGTLGEEYFRGYGARATFLVPVEPDHDFFAADPSASQVAHFRSAYGLDSDRSYMIFCGNVDANKRVDLLLDAFQQATKDRSDWGLLIAGDGPKRAELEARAVSRSLPVHWLGFLEGDELRVAYAVSSILVLPSDREAWGLVVNEALAAGLAVVCSSGVGASPELVEDRGTGRVFVKGDAGSLAEALSSLLEPGELARARAKTSEVLDRWRRDGDPVEGVRAALGSVGIDA